MSTINSFLQKNKLHENHHGIYMVVSAYILSFFLLFLGSDTFYGIVSKAERSDINSDEAAQITQEDKLINPYRMKEQSDITSKDTSSVPAGSDDTNWLLGCAMNAEEYDYAIMQMGIMQELQAPELGADETINKTVESFSVSAGVDQILTEISLEDVKMLERIVEAEAAGEDIIGRILIVNVIFNRIADKEFPDNVEDVIFQKVGGDYQFSPISDERYWEVEVTEDSREAVLRAMKGEDYSEGALYFMARKRAKKSSAKWFDENLDWLFKHGGHEFFKNW